MNVKRLDLGALLVLDALLKDNSVSQAAVRLSISQPSVSYALKKLRESLNDELFVRAGNRMLPTAMALKLEHPLQNLLAILHQDIMLESRFNPSTSERHFYIHTGDVGEVAFMPKLIKKLHECAPKVVIECAHYKTEQLPKALEEGEIDLVVGHIEGLDSLEIHRTKLFDHPFVCLVREGHPIINKTLSLDAYRKAQHIGLSGEGYSQQIFEDIIEQLAGEREVVFRSKHFMHLPLLVRDTDLVATLPKIVVAAQQLSGLKVFKPPFATPEVPVALYWHHRYHRDPALVWLRSIMHDLFFQQDPTQELEEKYGSLLKLG